MECLSGYHSKVKYKNPLIIMCSWFFHAYFKCFSLHLLKYWEWILFYFPFLNHKGKSKFLLDGSKCDQEEVSKNKILLLELLKILFCVQLFFLVNFHNVVTIFLENFANFPFKKNTNSKKFLKFSIIIIIIFKIKILLKNTSNFWNQQILKAKKKPCFDPMRW